MNGLIEDSAEFFTEANKYHFTAVNGRAKRPEVFNNEILYNLLSMAVEKYFMGYFCARTCLPENHTFSDLLDMAERIGSFPAELKDELLYLEKAQNLCPVFEPVTDAPISDEVIERLIAATAEVKKFCKPE